MKKVIIVNNFVKGRVFNRADENSFSILESKNNEHRIEVDTDDKHLMYMLNQFAPIKKQLEK